MQRRCSKNPPTLSCSDFAPKFNSILQHRTGSNKSTVPCSGFMEYFLEFQAWDGSVGVRVCTTTDYSQIPEKHFQGKELLPSPSLLSLPPPHLGNLKLIECENYLFFF